MSHIKNGKRTKLPKAKASDMIFLAVLSYLSILVYNVLEYLIVWTPLIDVVPLGNKIWTLVLRVLCCIIWGLVFYLIVKVSRNYGFDPLEKPFEAGRLIWISIVGTVSFIALFAIIDKGFSTPVNTIVSGGLGYLVLLAFQTVLRCLVISLAQKWGELAFPKAGGYIAFGGAALGILMALTHLITANDISEDIWGVLSTALLLAAIHIYFGFVYVYTGKKLVYTAPMVYLMLLMM